MFKERIFCDKTFLFAYDQAVAQIFQRQCLWVLEQTSSWKSGWGAGTRPFSEKKGLYRSKVILQKIVILSPPGKS